MDYRNIPKQEGIRKYNSIWLGLVAGVLVPFVGYAILLMLNEQIPSLNWNISGRAFDGFSLKLLGVVAICMNLIPFTIFQRKYMLTSMRGVFIPTLVYIVIWMTQYASELYN